MKRLIFIALLVVFACEDKDSSQDSEIDIDWILVKTPSMQKEFYSNYEDIEVIGIGYIFYYTSSSGVDIGDNIIEPEPRVSYAHTLNDESNGQLLFSYNGADFSYDLSDSYNEEFEIYFIRTEIDEEDLPQRIILNTELNYATLFGSEGFYGIELNTSSPNELIDYR